MRIAVVDTETTGFDPAEDRLVEIAGVIIEGDDRQWGIDTGAMRSRICNPGRPIPVGAMAVHHITNEMVAAGETPEATAAAIFGELGSVDYWAAHNLEFDYGFLKSMTCHPFDLPAERRICTWRAAEHIWPDAEGFSNQVLRYWLPVYPPLDSEQAHRAGYDAATTAAILVRLLSDAGLTEVVRLSNPALPIIQRRVRFGKSRGKLWSEMDRGFMRWVLNNDFDPDTKASARHYLDILRLN